MPEIRPSDTQQSRRPGELHVRPSQVVIFALIVLAIYGGWRAYLAWRIDREFKTIRAAGYPVTPKDLRSWSPVPSGTNAAGLILDAGQYYPEGASKASWFPIFRASDWPESVFGSEYTQELDRYLAQYRDVLAMLHKASEIGAAYYSFEEGPELLQSRPDYVYPVVRGANLLAMQAVSHAHHGRSGEAGRSLVASINIAQSLRNEPSLLSQQVRLAALQQTIDAFAWVLPFTDFDAAIEEELRHELVAIEDPEPLTRAYAATRCLGAWFYGLPFDRQLVVLGSRGGHSEMQHCLYRYSGQIELDMLCFYDFMDRFVALTALPPDERFTAFQSVAAESRAISSAINPGSAAYFPVMPHAIEESTDLIARARAASILLAVDRYAATQGELPNALQELVPEYLDAVPRDPYTGDAIGYQRSEGAVRVYSAGSGHGGAPLPTLSFPEIISAIRGGRFGPRITYEFVAEPGLRLELRPKTSTN